LWGFAFKWLILDFGKKITLTETEKTELIKVLEDRLKRVEKDVWLAENAVSLLAEYYTNEKDESNLMRVLDVFEKSLKTKRPHKLGCIIESSRIRKNTRDISKIQQRFSKAKIASDRISQEIASLI